MAPKKENPNDAPSAANSALSTKIDPAPHLDPHRFKTGESGNPKGRPRILLEVALKARQKLDAHRLVLEEIAANTAAKNKDRISAIEVHRGFATGETLKVRVDDTPTDDDRTDLDLLRELAEEMGFELIPKSSGDLERVEKAPDLLRETLESDARNRMDGVGQGATLPSPSELPSPAEKGSGGA